MNDFTTVGVSYTLNPTSQDKIYTFKTDLQLIKGDIVVLPNNNSLYAFGVIAEVHDTPQVNPKATYEYKWVIDKVDLTNHNTRMQS